MVAPFDNEDPGPMRPRDWIILAVAAVVALAVLAGMALGAIR